MRISFGPDAAMAHGISPSTFESQIEVSSIQTAEPSALRKDQATILAWLHRTHLLVRVTAPSAYDCALWQSCSSKWGRLPLGDRPQRSR